MKKFLKNVYKLEIITTKPHERIIRFYRIYPRTSFTSLDVIFPSPEPFSGLLDLNN